VRSPGLEDRQPSQGVIRARRDRYRSPLSVP
jgi:hypothetical protein